MQENQWLEISEDSQKKVQILIFQHTYKLFFPRKPNPKKAEFWHEKVSVPIEQVTEVLPDMQSFSEETHPVSGLNYKRKLAINK